MGKYKLEVACFSLSGALAAQAAGANRLELCENPADGGTTPSYGMLRAAREKISIPVFPIIRPRGGDFLYTDDEFGMISDDIKLCKSIGFEGVVFGALQEDGSVNEHWIATLVALAYPMEVTFHRAFDRCKDPFASLEQLIKCGCQRVLTSGQYPAATEGSSLLGQLVDQADDRIIIMPGSGINSKNISRLASQTGAVEFHASARTAVETKMQFTVPSMNESLYYMGVDAAEVSLMAQILQGLENGS